MIYSKFVFALYAFSRTSWIFLDLLADAPSLCSLIVFRSSKEIDLHQNVKSLNLFYFQNILRE